MYIIKAGDGNRTHVSSLEGWCSTIELHPQRNYLVVKRDKIHSINFTRYRDTRQNLMHGLLLVTRVNRGDRIRTCDLLVPNQAL